MQIAIAIVFTHFFSLNPRRNQNENVLCAIREYTFFYVFLSSIVCWDGNVYVLMCACRVHLIIFVLHSRAASSRCAWNDSTISFIFFFVFSCSPINTCLNLVASHSVHSAKCENTRCDKRIVQNSNNIYNNLNTFECIHILIARINRIYSFQFILKIDFRAP